MSNNKESNPSGAPSLIDAVISAGKSAVKKLGAEEVKRFIAAQPTIKGDVTINSVGGASAVGASSGILIFNASYDEGAGRVSRDLVLRYAPGSETRLFFEYDLSRQFKVQKALQGSAAPVPNPLWLDPDGRWLGVSGYIMEFRPGIAPHPSSFARGPLAEASPTVRARMLDQIMRAEVAIHQTDIKASGLGDFAMNAPGDTLFRQCINWYWKTWEWVHPEQYERLVPIHRWLLEHAPNYPAQLTHGDATLHNFLFDEGKLIAVLDWEMSCLGYAENDLALQCVTNVMHAPPLDSGLTQPPSEEEWLALYQKAGGRPLRQFAYFKKAAAYMVVVAVTSLQRNLPKEAIAMQEPLLRPCWALLDS